MRDIKAESKDPDLRVQLDVFEEQKESDESQVKVRVNFVLKALGIIRLMQEPTVVPVLSLESFLWPDVLLSVLNQDKRAPRSQPYVKNIKTITN